MKLAYANKNVVVYDDVMDENAYAALWKWVQLENYATSHSGSWHKVWHLTDAQPMMGHEWQASKRPWNNGMDICAHYISEIAKHHKDHLGEEGKDWNEVVYRSYLYARNSKISWHNDMGYASAAVFYTHPRWSPQWGGELFVAEVPEKYDLVTQESGPHLTHDWWDGYLSERGVGLYIQPKPNRLVLMPAGTWHMINRVDADAGDNVRCSITAFFKKVNHPQAPKPEGDPVMAESVLRADRLADEARQATTSEG